MQIVLAAPDGASSLTRVVPAIIEVAAAEPLRFRIDASGTQGILRAALRLPSREWERRHVEMRGRHDTSTSPGIEFFATGLAPGRHEVHFDATLEVHEGGLVQESHVAGTVVLDAR